eukprot:TRINITY_DN41239_c0_g1_i1.p1 TRINITY_DN41239_c0_g1~~TRINITY_DN41239_c0_g1_i1.p1  ORF type:complete len:327 (-),score=77.17 TRINITY_DN41239_c0_g1_i1:165-1145(-)
MDAHRRATAGQKTVSENETHQISSRLAGAGTQIAHRVGGAKAPVAVAGRDERRSPRGATRGRAQLQQHSDRVARSAAEGCDILPRGGEHDSLQFTSAPTSATVDPSIAHVPDELAQGLHALLRRLENVSANNSDLQRRLDLQSQEMRLLHDAGVSHQRVLRDFERRTEEERRAAAAVIGARVSAEEAKHRAESERARGAQAELIERCQRGDEERLALQAELREARLLLAQESEARQVAEGAMREAQRELREGLEHARRDVLDLQRELARQRELAKSQEERCEDLEARYKRHKSKAKQLLRQEQDKFQVVSRLDGMLPRSLLMKAVS